MTEIKTIYDELEQIIDYSIESAPDEWDRLYNADFFVNIKRNYIELQVNPAWDVSHILPIPGEFLWNHNNSIGYGNCSCSVVSELW